MSRAVVLVGNPARPYSRALRIGKKTSKATYAHRYAFSKTGRSQEPTGRAPLAVQSGSLSTNRHTKATQATRRHVTRPSPRTIPLAGTIQTP